MFARQRVHGLILDAAAPRGAFTLSDARTPVVLVPADVGAARPCHARPARRLAQPGVLREQ